MKVIKPIKVTETNWYAVNFNQMSDYAAWNSGVAYPVGTIRCYLPTKSQYKCIIATNAGEDPEAFPTKWARIGSMQIWRPFDGFISQSPATVLGSSTFDATGLGLWAFPGLISQKANKFTFSLTGLGAFDTVAVLATDCSQVRAYFYDQNGTKQTDLTIRALDDTQIVDAWDYCFGDLTYRRDFVFEGFDGWGSTNLSQLYIEISYDALTTFEAPIGIGEIVVGQSRELGRCHSDAKIQLVDYSKKNIDEYGTVTIVQRAYSQNASFEIEIATVDRNRVQALITSLRATPCVYYPTAGDANQGIAIYGYVKDYNTTYATPDRAYAALEVEGMI
ncbi:hypothetical protein [Cypionkella sinensis]|uniref:Uncharacterized protein n=1 Tax=Cypionkella sinensis TaxID=1756043 RepID=A0ABV7IZV0_9RHOB